MLFKFIFLSKKLLMLSIVVGEPHLVFYILLSFLLSCSFLLSSSSEGRPWKRLELNSVSHRVTPESSSLYPPQI